MGMLSPYIAMARSRRKEKNMAIYTLEQVSSRNFIMGTGISYPNGYFYKVSEAYQNALKGKITPAMAKNYAVNPSVNLLVALEMAQKGTLQIINLIKNESVVLEGEPTSGERYIALIRRIGTQYHFETAEVILTEVDGKPVESRKKVSFDDYAVVFPFLVYGFALISSEDKVNALRPVWKPFSEMSEGEIGEWATNVAEIEFLINTPALSQFDLADASQKHFHFFNEVKSKAVIGKKLDYKFKVDADGYYIPDPDYFLIKGQKESFAPKLSKSIIISDIAIMMHKEITYAGNLEPFRNFLLKGIAGTGKTQICYQLAFMLGIPYFVYSFNANTEASDLLGFIQPVQNDKGETVFKYIESPITAWCKADVGLLELQEPNTPRQAGAIVAMNSMLAEGRASLPNGENVIMSKNLICVATMNEDYEGTKDFNQSFLSRMNEVIKIDALSTKEMVERIGDSTIDKNLLSRMAQAIANANKFIAHNDEARGVASFREYKAWVQKAEMLAGANPVSANIIIDASRNTVYNKMFQSCEAMEWNEFVQTILSPLM